MYKFSDDLKCLGSSLWGSLEEKRGYDSVQILCEKLYLLSFLLFSAIQWSTVHRQLAKQPGELL